MKASLLTEPRIVCPKCSTSIKLTESLAAPLIAKTRRQFEQQLADKQSEFTKREFALRKAQSALKKARDGIDDEVTAKLQVERASIAEAEAKKARLALAADLKQRDRQLADLQRNLDSNNAKLAEAQQAQAGVIRKARELDDARRELDLSVQKQVQESLATVRSEAKAEAEESLQAKVLEKEIQISGMQHQIEELRRKSEQGSQQLQGEALELELETLLRERFPRDLIEPVPTGELGGDILHTVLGTSGQRCGTMLWETKRTKAWNDRWLIKLRDDQRVANSDIALIVSRVLPKGIETFDLIDGVWVTKLRYAIPLATALRQTLVEAANSRHAAAGQQTKIELVYQYLTGPRFRRRIDAIVEKFTDMQADLDRERKTTMRLWAKREEQLKGVLDSSAGLYGDLQGIAGPAMAEIESLNLLMIEKESTLAAK
jgi:hypothetical protein